MKKFLALSLALVLVLGLGVTAYASASDGEVSDIVEEVTGVFRRGFGRNVDNNTAEEKLNILDQKLSDELITQEEYDKYADIIENGCIFNGSMDGTGFRKGSRLVDKSMFEELKDLTSEEQYDLLEEKLANEEITQEAYDRFADMIENGCTFELAMDGTGFRGFKLIGKSIFEELKDLTSEEQLALLEEKLANEEITQEEHDKLVNMTENGCTFNPVFDGSNKVNKARRKGNFNGRKGMNSKKIGTEI